MTSGDHEWGEPKDEERLSGAQCLLGWIVILVAAVAIWTGVFWMARALVQM